MASADHLHVVSRSVARAIGQSFYFSGVPCKKGHLGWRSVGSSNCAECLAEHRSRPEVKAKLVACQKQRMQNPEVRKKANAAKRRYHHENREAELAKMRERNRAYYLANSERIKDQVRSYQAKESENRKAYKAQWQRDVLKRRPEYAAMASMRKLVARVCERIKKNRRELGRTVSALGYSTVEFRMHIERQFLHGMSWANRSEWHIDHIIPLATFDLTDPDERRAANALSNLRPIWAADNMAKSDKIITLL